MKDRQTRPELDDSRRVWRATWQQAMSTLGMGWDLVLPIVGGAVLGHYVDRRLASHFAFSLLLLVLGVTIGVYNTVYNLRRELRRHQHGVTGPARAHEWDWTEEAQEHVDL